MTESVLAGVAAHGLPDAHAVLDLDLDDTEVRELLREANRHRLLGLVVSAVSDGALRVSEVSFAAIAEAHESWSSHVLRAERLLLELVGRLEEAGIDYRLFKGSALAHSVYHDPAQRMFADLDILVPGHEFDRAAELVVRDVAGRRVLPELRAGFDEEFGKETLVKVDNVEVDLHRTFVTGPIGLSIALDELFVGGESVTIGSRPVPTLAPVPLFLQVCVNAAVGDFPIRLLSLRDVAEVVRTHDPDPCRIEALAREWRCLSVVQRALGETWTRLELESTELSRWAASLQPGRFDQLLMRSYLTPARSYTRPAASLAVIPGIRPKLRYLRAIVAPRARVSGCSGLDADPARSAGHPKVAPAMTSALYCRHPESLWRYSLRGVLVCPPGTDASHVVGTPGDVVWSLLDRPTSVAALAAELADAFDAPVDRVGHDVQALLDELTAIGAVQMVVGGSHEPQP